MTSNLRDGFVIPMPKPGDGTKIFANRDGSLTCSWDRPPAPRMALDAALSFNGPAQAPQSGGGDPEGDDLEGKVRELLTGKLDEADLDALLELIMGTGAAPQPQPIAGDSRRGMATDALLRSRVSTALERQARTTSAGLLARFPALKNARVVG